MGKRIYDWDGLKDSILHQLHQGWTVVRIAEAIGCNPHSVSHQLDLWGATVKALRASSGPRSTLPPERADEARQRIASGDPCTAIARDWGCDRSTLLRFCDQHGITRPVGGWHRGSPRVPDSVVQEMIALHKQGLTQQEIGDKFGRSQSEVSRLCRRAGKRCVNRPAGRPDVIEKHKEGK